jgi:hypothetical protein
MSDDDLFHFRPEPFERRHELAHASVLIHQDLLSSKAKAEAATGVRIIECPLRPVNGSGRKNSSLPCTLRALSA